MKRTLLPLSMSRMIRFSLMAISVGSLLSACTGETRPDKAPAPVEDRGIRVDSSQPVVLSRASEIAPMQQAKPEPSVSAPVVKEKASADSSAPKQAVFETVNADEKTTEVAPAVQQAVSQEKEQPILSSRQFEKTPNKTQADTKTQNDQQAPTDIALLQAERTSADEAPPAITALTADADRAIRARDYDKAAASLERALRMEPRDAYLWHRLAYTRLQQGKGGQAESLALKSNSLAGDKQELVNSNWRLISRSRKQRDDLGGAQQALEQIR